MKQSEEIEKQLWEYLDGTCSQEEKKTIDRKIKEDTAWGELFTELQQLHQTLQTDEGENPSPAFTNSVMQTISISMTKQPKKSYVNKYIIGGITAFFLLIIFAGLCQGFYSYSLKSSPALLPQIRQQLPIRINFNMNTYLLLIGVNITLALAILDKIYRRKMYEHQ
jgi:hypothetical protein